ncbi:hypothetical protein SNE40_019644 [Patella caerulea]|uniref:WAP domain-containing protein n=1 Tax=Patella caerulea TaxID=87958 RepID=A0AAN8J9S8_PATCE
MLHLLVYTLALLSVVKSDVYPCTVAKCAPGLICHAVEGACGRLPCPLLARCMNKTSVFEPCPFGRPILQVNGRPIHCGHGPSGRICPRSSRCIIDPTDKFAVCCWSNNAEDDYLEKPSSDVLAYDGVCPVIPPPYAMGICVEQCKSDNECLDGLKCCGTGCGRMCLTAEAPKPIFTCPMPPLNPFGSCIDVCIFESDCQPNERCCSNGCGHVCMTAQDASKAMLFPALKQKERQGFCPPEKTIRYIECSEKEQCTKDDDCFGIRKCCYNDQCGHICLNPKSKQLQVDPWLYKWKNRWFQ